jgi:hypothetical protein
MSQDRGQGIGDRAGVERVPNTPHAGRYFVTDAMLLAGERELVDPIRAIDDATVRMHFLLGQLAGEDWLIRSKPDGASWERYRDRLLLLAATAMQAAKQLGLDSRQDAIAKEIPF